VLEDAGVDHAERGAEEAEGDAADGVEVDVGFSEGGIDDDFCFVSMLFESNRREVLTIEKRDERKHKDCRQVLHQVVRRVPKIHLACLGDQVVEDLSPADGEEGEEEEVLIAD
jgi:hypothetical protein